MSQPFLYYLRVRYGECDAQKVVFNARYGDYVDIAVVEFLRSLGFGDELKDGRFDYQLVRQVLEWHAPAHFDDILAAEVRCARLGNSSFTLTVRFLRAGDEALLATAETVYVMVRDNPEQGLCKQPLPDNVRAALDAGACDRVVDHAGYRAGYGAGYPSANEARRQASKTDTP